jgi:hypothetical protein
MPLSMPSIRRLIIWLVIIGVSHPVFAQSTTDALPRADARPAARLNLTVPPEQLIPPPSQQPVSAAMHPVAKGALIGGLAGAAFVGAVGLWYCTVGPSEVGECESPRWIWKGLAMYGGAGAGIGALIGAMVDRR